MSNLAFCSYSRDYYLNFFLDCKVYIFMLRRATGVLRINIKMKHNRHNRNTYVALMINEEYAALKKSKSRESMKAVENRRSL